MDSVVSGLIGVVAGGLLTGGVQTAQGWRDRVRARRSAARLVFGDYVGALGALRFLRDTGIWWRDDLAPTVEDWRGYRTSLPAGIDGDAWTTVDGAFTQLGDLELSRRAARAIEGDAPLLADGTSVDSGREAYDAMERAGAELLSAGFTRRDRRRMRRNLAADADDGVAIALGRLDD